MTLLHGHYKNGVKWTSEIFCELSSCICFIPCLRKKTSKIIFVITTSSFHQIW